MIGKSTIGRGILSVAIFVGLLSFIGFPKSPVLRDPVTAIQESCSPVRDGTPILYLCAIGTDGKLIRLNDESSSSSGTGNGAIRSSTTQPSSNPQAENNIRGYLEYIRLFLLTLPPASDIKAVKIFEEVNPNRTGPNTAPSD